MAVRTLGTNATTTLQAIKWAHSAGGLAAADVATIINGILDDQSNAHQAAATLGTGGFDIASSTLYVPNRGFLKVFPNDFLAIDPNGWPLLISANSIAGTGWTHT